MTQRRVVTQMRGARRPSHPIRPSALNTGCRIPDKLPQQQHSCGRRSALLLRACSCSETALLCYIIAMVAAVLISGHGTTRRAGHSNIDTGSLHLHVTRQDRSACWSRSIPGFGQTLFAIDFESLSGHFQNSNTLKPLSDTLKHAPHMSVQQVEMLRLRSGCLDKR